MTVVTRSNKFIRDHGADNGAECRRDGDYGAECRRDGEILMLLPFYISCYIFSKEKKINSIKKLYMCK